MVKRSVKISVIAAFFGLFGCNGNLMGKDMDPRKHFDNKQVIALAKATTKGDIEEIDRLVAAGVDVNARGKNNLTPLLWSIGGKNKKGIRRLLEHGASPNILTDGNDSFVGFVARLPDTDYLKMALEFGGDPNLRNSLKETVLFTAAIANHENVNKTFDILIDSGADINAVDYSGVNAAMAAAGINQFESAYILLEKGIDYTQKNQWGFSIVYQLEGNKISFNPGGEKYDARTKMAAFLEERGVAVDLNEPYSAPDNWLELSYKAIGRPLPERLR